MRKLKFGRAVRAAMRHIIFINLMDFILRAYLLRNTPGDKLLVRSVRALPSVQRNIPPVINSGIKHITRSLEIIKS